MSAETLPGMHLLPPVGDKLDRRYTPQALADAIVDSLWLDSPQRILEPSVGGGAFARACQRRWPRAHVSGLDVDPDAPGFAHCTTSGVIDFLDWRMSTYDLIVGNPPFGSALKHVAHALSFGCAVVFVLPLAYLGVQAWRPVLTMPRLLRVSVIAGRPWPAHVRECAVYEFAPWQHTAPVQLSLLDGWPK